MEKYVWMKPHRVILKFMDNASSHGAIESMANLSNMRIQFLLQRTTPILQPIYLGIIASIKKCHKKEVTLRAVDLLEEGYLESFDQNRLETRRILNM